MSISLYLHLPSICMIKYSLMLEDRVLRDQAHVKIAALPLGIMSIP